MKCQKCDRPADYIVENIHESKPEHKRYILCTMHYMDLNRFLVQAEIEFLLKGGDTNGTKS